KIYIDKKVTFAVNRPTGIGANLYQNSFNDSMSGIAMIFDKALAIGPQAQAVIEAIEKEKGAVPERISTTSFAAKLEDRKYYSKPVPSRGMGGYMFDWTPVKVSTQELVYVYKGQSSTFYSLKNLVDVQETLTLKKQESHWEGTLEMQAAGQKTLNYEVQCREVQ
ncbi:MAG: hypothetical protein AAGB31_16520, partial [Bdellovibrio sp.]